jgi:hypothetical protein
MWKVGACFKKETSTADGFSLHVEVAFFKTSRSRFCGSFILEVITSQLPIFKKSFLVSACSVFVPSSLFRA